MNAFRSLAVRNYRIWAAGAVISNVGTWMQRTAQDWIVLVELTRHNATAMGIVMSLQFGPQLLLSPITGLTADRFDRRKLLLVTQATMGVLALLLGLLTIFHLVQLWHVYVFALLLGCTAAFDAPARQTFVSELVEEAHISNAVALNSTSFHAARMVGPAFAGLLIAAIGTGWVFLLNAASFVAVLCALSLLNRDELRPLERLARSGGGFIGGLRYVLRRQDLLIIFFMMLLVGTFAINFQIFIATMAVGVFHAGPGQFGVLSSMMAVGSVAGALLAAQREQPTMRLLIFSAAAMGVALAASALSPSYLLFGLMLMFVGLAAQTLTTSSISKVQLSVDAVLRGRVIALLLAVTLGTTPIGGPIAGWIADTFGPRWSMAVGALACIIAASVALYFETRQRRATAHEN